MFAIIACASTLVAQDHNVGECVRRSDIFRDAEYAHPLPALRQVVADKARQTRNTFYVSPVCYFSNGVSNVMVYWREGRALILWEPYSNGDGPSQRRHELVWSRRFLLLNRDVVPTIDQVAGSSFLLPKALARHDILDCVRHGRKFVLYKRPRVR